MNRAAMWLHWITFSPLFITKALHYFLFVIVMSCSSSSSGHGSFFVGLCQMGAWGCFDEFNRVEERMLSAVSQQVQYIQVALKEHTNANRDRSRSHPSCKHTMLSLNLQIQWDSAAILQPYFNSTGLVIKALEHASKLEHIMDFTHLRYMGSFVLHAAPALQECRTVQQQPPPWLPHAHRPAGEIHAGTCDVLFLAKVYWFLFHYLFYFISISYIAYSFFMLFFIFWVNSVNYLQMFMLLLWV